MSATNQFARLLRSLHKPGSPLVFANVYDVTSARAVARLSSCKALATASYAVAIANGTTDNDLTLETNLAAVKNIAPIAREFAKPLSVDIQDGYGARLDEAIASLVKLGVVGCNLEDCDKATGKMIPLKEAAERVKRAVSVAAENGVPDFAVNARCDALMHGGELDEVIERGKAYLEAGATTVFVLGGGKRGTSGVEVKQLVSAFEGRLNVGMRLTPDHLTVKQLAEIGVARISIGPQLQAKAVEAISREAQKILEGEA